MPKPFLSVIVLCYKAESTLIELADKLIQHLRKTRLDYEVILVANTWNNKKDSTPSVARRIARSNRLFRVVSHLKQGGMGWDVLSGLKKARGEILVFVDGDAQNPLEDVMRVVRALQRKKADLAKTVRVRRFDGTFRTVQSIWYNRLFRILYQDRSVSDVNGKPKAMTRSLYERLHLSSTDWFIDAEIVYKTRKLGGNIVEIPTVFFMNPTRPSFVHIQTAFEFLKNMVRYWVKPPVVA